MSLFEGSSSFASTAALLRLFDHLICFEDTPMLPTNTTLLVIDVQKGFLDASWGPRNNPDAEANIARLIAAWRHDGRPIRHVYHSSRSPEGSFVSGTAGFDPKPEAAPTSGEPIHVKQVNSAFIGTSLEQDLRKAGVNTLVVVGLTTNHCVSTTVRMAGNLGFTVYLVEDATATFDRMGLDGKVRPAAEVHAAALSDLSEEFATIVSADTVLRALDTGTPLDCA
jgi:nicotinamidase-related amidase